MGLSDELERLARLHRQGALSRQEFEKAKARVLAPAAGGCVRRESAHRILGLPLWAIASGPDPARGEMRGHAKGIVALGDIATGVLAIGGMARGVVALGGLAVGLLSVGGAAIGLLGALGGAAIGAVALGGGAAGGVAVGGGAVGLYALGGGAAGGHVISASRCDREARAFFAERLGWLAPVGQLLADPPAGRTGSLCAPPDGTVPAHSRPAP